MDVVKGFATLALAVILFAGMPLVGAAEERTAETNEGEEPFVAGRIEEVGTNGILVNGRYYYIDDAAIEDGHMNRLGRDALEVGADVDLYLQGTKVMHIIIKKGSPGE